MLSVAGDKQACYMKISIAIPTRERLVPLRALIETLIDTANEQLEVLVLHDAPEDRSAVRWASKCKRLFNLEFPIKQSMTALWNKGLLYSSGDWVLVCNDDVLLKDGWRKYLEEIADEKRHKQIILCAYSAFCIHKSVIPLLGWFDERFTGGYYEDVDWQMRLGESGFEELVDFSHDSVFVEHRKAVSPRTPEWPWQENARWFCEKWGRRDYTDWTAPSFRKAPEIDWYPGYTKKYCQQFGVNSRIDEINSNVGCGRPVFATTDRVHR